MMGTSQTDSIFSLVPRLAHNVIRCVPGNVRSGNTSWPESNRPSCHWGEKWGCRSLAAASAVWLWGPTGRFCSRRAGRVGPDSSNLSDMAIHP